MISFSLVVIKSTAKLPLIYLYKVQGNEIMKNRMKVKDKVEDFSKV